MDCQELPLLLGIQGNLLQMVPLELSYKEAMKTLPQDREDLLPCHPIPAMGVEVTTIV